MIKPGLETLSAYNQQVFLLEFCEIFEYYINPFHATGLFLDPVKVSENP